MWIASKYGFFSIVKAKGTDSHWQIRARSDADLAELFAAADRDADIITCPDADYRFRAIVDEETFRSISDTLFASVDYPDFKGMIGKRKSQKDKLPWYHNIWSEMWNYQTKKHGGI